MTALELRILTYGLAALLLIGTVGTGGYKLASHHYQALMAADRAAESEALTNAQARVIAAQQAQAAASDAAEKQYEHLKADSDALGKRLTDSLRQYSALRGLIVSQASHPSGSADATGPRTGGTPDVAELSGQAASACLKDAAELTALQSWAKAISATP